MTAPVRIMNRTLMEAVLDHDRYAMAIDLSRALECTDRTGATSCLCGYHNRQHAVAATAIAIAIAGRKFDSGTSVRVEVRARPWRLR